MKKLLSFCFIWTLVCGVAHGDDYKCFYSTNDSYNCNDQSQIYYVRVRQFFNCADSSEDLTFVVQNGGSTDCSGFGEGTLYSFLGQSCYKCYDNFTLTPIDSTIMDKVLKSGNIIPTKSCSSEWMAIDGITKYYCKCTLSETKTGNWESFATGYERRKIEKLDDESCTYPTSLSKYEYRCAVGYYGSSTNGTSGCSKCNTINGIQSTTSSAGQTSCTACCVEAGATGTNTKGAFKLTTKCCNTSC